MLTVAAVCVPGGEYTAEHVTRLHDQIKPWAPKEWAFRVITSSDKPGWWAKIDLFKPGMFEGRVLYFDLDVDIIGPIIDLAGYPAPFVAIKDWNLSGINSSVMAWDAGVCDHVYEQWAPEAMGRYPGGDQQYIHQKIKCATFPPEWCVSYKKHVRPTGVARDGARVVVFHGKPKPWDVEIGRSDRS